MAPCFRGINMMLDPYENHRYENKSLADFIPQEWN